MTGMSTTTGVKTDAPWHLWLVGLIYTYLLTDGGAIMGRSMAITSAVITALLLFFL